MAEYRILKEEWFAQGKVESLYYTVESTHKTWFGKIKWKPFTEEKVYHNGITRIPIRFKTIDDAKEFIEARKGGNPIEGKKTSVVHLDSDAPIFEPITK